MATDLELARSRQRGRPSLYNPVYCDRVLELAAEGCSKAEIAAALSVSANTLSAWMKAHDEFKEAMARAKELEYAWWLAAGRKGQFMRNWSANGWALQIRNRFRKRFRDKAPALSDSEQKGEVNAEALREEIERKLSRLLEPQEQEGVSGGVDTAGVGEPEV